MIRIRSLYHCCLIALILLPTVGATAQLYRYIDSNGTTTLSKTLPADAAQRGYDILDDHSMRLIERVPAALTALELEQETKRLLDEQAVREKAEKEAKSKAQLRKQQRIYDRNLLAIYRSEAELILARDEDISQWQDRVNALQNKQPVLKKRLLMLQQQAAERELSGASISGNLQQSLLVAEQDLDNNQQLLKASEAELARLTQQYAMDHQRLLELLNNRIN